MFKKIMITQAQSLKYDFAAPLSMYDFLVDTRHLRVNMEKANRNNKLTEEYIEPCQISNIHFFASFSLFL